VACSLSTAFIIVLCYGFQSVFSHLHPVYVTKNHIFLSNNHVNCNCCKLANGIKTEHWLFIACFGLYVMVCAFACVELLVVARAKYITFLYCFHPDALCLSSGEKFNQAISSRSTGYMLCDLKIGLFVM